MNEEVTIPQLDTGTYRHNKTGNLYDVIGIALNTETESYVVVYRPLYNHESGYKLFTRAYTAFIENVTINAKIVPRFELVEE